MTIHPAPSAILAPVLVAGLLLAARAAWQRKGAARPSMRVVLAAVFAPLVLGLAVLAGFDTGERRWPIWLGLALGGVLGLLWEWAWPAGEGDPAELGPLASGLAALALLGLMLPLGVPFANGALGLVAAWGVVQLTAIGLAEAPAGGLGLAGVALAAGTAAWATQLSGRGDEPGLLGPLPLAIALCAAAGLAIAALLGERRAGAVGVLVAVIVFKLAALAVALGVYHQPTPLLWAVGAGAGGALVAGLWLPKDGPVGTGRALVFLLVAGVLLILENRLNGILAIGLGGLGLLAAGHGQRGPRVLVALAVAIFAARVWLQLFLDRTNLTGYGIDLTHPYAFAALIVGGLLPVVALTTARVCRDTRGLGLVWGVGLVALPVWLGYMIHVEAMGSLLAGLVLAAFGIGARGNEREDGSLLALAPSLLLAMLATVMLAGPWLVEHMDATRDARVHWLLGSAVLAFLLVAYGYVRRPRPA